MRKVTVYPPSSPHPEEMFILRERYRRRLTVLLPWGDSYTLTPAEMRTYLKMLGDPFPDVAVDKVWNFFAIHYHVEPHESRIVPVGDVKEVMEQSAPVLVGVQ